MLPKYIAKFLLSITGMRLVDHNNGNYPDKYVVVVAPHTSNRDFPYGIYTRAMMGQFIGFVGKDSLFRFPIGPILKMMGGVPVVRSKRTNFVDAVADLFRTRKELKLCIAAEGTRKKVDRFKTGFYFIALKAGVPLVLCRFDFGNKKIEYSKPYQLTGDIRKDFDYIYRHFDGVRGLVPENSFHYDPAVLDALPEVRD